MAVYVVSLRIDIMITKPRLNLRLRQAPPQEAFQSSLHGELILPGHSDYDSARRLWNGLIDKYPSMIVRCADTADVVRSVRFARAAGLQVAVRGGGHNVAGYAVCDG